MQDKDGTSAAKRVCAFEYLRILAAFGIVWFHNSEAPLHWLGLSGLWVFLLISFMFLASMKPDQPLSVFAAGRARRVMVPWLFWSAVYLLCSSWRFCRHGTPFFEDWMLLTGFSLHLWYLPYLFGASVVLYLARCSVTGIDGPWGVLFFMTGALAMLAANGFWQPDTPPFAQWLTAVPLTLLGYAFGRIALVRDTRSRRVAATTVALCVIIVCSARISIPGHYGQDGATVLLGFALFIAANALPLPSTAAVRLLAPLTLGIYLIHPLVMDMFARATGESGSPLRIVMIFVASAVIIYGMKRIPVLRMIV